MDRLLRALLACALLLTLLGLWRLASGGSCGFLVLPLLVWCAISHGLLLYHLQRRRFVLEFYLAAGSHLRRWFRRPAVAVTLSLLKAAGLTAFLSVFVALSDPPDWYFLGAGAILVPLLFVGAGRWPGAHLRDDAADRPAGPSLRDVLAARIAGWVALAGLLGAYVYFGYYWIPVPGDLIHPHSLERTLQAFAGRAGSACPVVADTLSVSTRIEGLAWWLVTTVSSAPWMQDGLRLLLWVGFLGNAALAFGGFVRGLEGAMLLVEHVVARRPRR